MSVTAFLKLHKCPACGRPALLEPYPSPPSGLFATTPAIFGICGRNNVVGCAHLYATDLTGDGTIRNVKPHEKGWIQADPDRLALFKKIHEETIQRLRLIG